MNNKKLIAILAVICICSPLSILAMQNDEENSDAGIIDDTLNGVTGTLTRVLVVAPMMYVKVLLGDLGSGSGDENVPTTSTEGETNAELRRTYAQMEQTNYTTASNFFSQLVTNEAQMWTYLKSYFDTQAENAAAAYWTDSKSFDADNILLLSGMIDNVSTYYYNVASTWDSFSLSWSEYHNQFWSSSAATNIYGNNMTLSWMVGDNSISWSSTEPAWSSLKMAVTPSSNSNIAYISTYDEESMNSNANDMYVFGNSSTYTIQNLSTGQHYTLSSGVNDTRNVLVTGTSGTTALPSGYYKFASGATYVGNIQSSLDSNGMTSTAAMILYNGSSYSAITVGNSGFDLLTTDTTSKNNSAVKLKITYTNASNEIQTITADIGKILTAYNTVNEKINDAMRSAIQKAQVCWMVYDDLGSASKYVHPSMITSGLNQENDLSTEQLYNMYVLAMQEIAHYSGDLSSDNLKVSEESLNLYCYGNIYYNDQLYIENAVFTPMVYLNNQSLSVQDGLEWRADGLIVIWDSGVSDLASWTGTTNKMSQVETSSQSMYSFDIKSIRYNGESVTSVDLTVVTWDKLGLIDWDVTPHPFVIDYTDLSNYIMIILILAGCCVGLMGWMFKSPILLIIAGILVIVGIFLSDSITRLIT